MKRYLFFFFVFILFNVEAALAQDEILFDRNSNEIIVDKNISGDGNKYVLKNIRESEVVSVETPNPTVFSVYDFRFGYFDTSSKYTVSKPEINRLIDNNVSTNTDQKTLVNAVIWLNEEIEIEAYYFFGSASAEVPFRFYHKGKIVHEATYKFGIHQVDNLMVDEIRFAAVDLSNKNIGEIELFVREKVEYKPVSNLTINNIDYETATVSFDLPDEKQFVSNNIYLKDSAGEENLVYKGLTTNYKIENLKASSNYSVRVESVYSDGKKVDSIREFSTKEYESLEVVSVTNILDTSVKFNYVLPEYADKIEIFDNENSLIHTTSNESSYILKNLTANTKYTFKFKAIYKDDTRSNEQKVTFTTLEKLNREVSKLSATSTDQNVSLGWEMPVYDSLAFARIYRQKTDSSFIARTFMAESTYEPMFETNGTTFKDLTVKSDTEYQYKVTTVDVLGDETDGKTVKISTKKVSIDGSGTSINENGDYLITWNYPIIGKMKVLIAGVEFATVPAANKQIEIPKDKMKFDITGKPNVTLIPITEDGQEGIPSSPGGGNNSGGNGGIGDIVGGGDAAEILNPENVLISAVSLLGVVGSFLLLGLAFRVVPKLIQTIRAALGARNKKDNVLPGTGRRT